ncbi:S-layer homology domain-containing protein [Paenibacillus sp. PAMC21692]|uniref:S-layer homology domain-containing protein n=1 Tax=Paenibacillus sp. PAMC21692 TaxID=2762320 RepID=UPI00164EC7B2|nr:S-layer homology domain-containing protein [Paenibacillus sp. PAMC21692]QNK57746.1 S-layer homology domain-containing protein [Paenibacillus sp. PAMC21692]
MRILFLIMAMGLSLIGNMGSAGIAHAYQETIQGAGTLQTELPQPAATPTYTLTLDGSLTDWVYDEQASAIYAISSETNKLYFIHADTLTIANTVSIGSMPSDIEQYGDQLFIALSGATGIQVVQASTGEKKELLATTGQPKRLTVTKDLVLYSTADDKLYRLDQNTRASNLVYSRTFIGRAVLKANEAAKLVYVGEQGSTGSDLYAIHYETNQLVDNSTYDGNYGFGFPSPYVGFDGTDVFFGGSRLNGTSLAQIHGAYPRFKDFLHLDSKLMDMNASVVATSEGIIDKQQYTPLVTFPYDALKVLLGTGGRTFLQPGTHTSNIIEAYDFNLLAMKPTLEFMAGPGGSVVSNYAIDSWTTSDSDPNIYLVSSYTNELAVLRKADFSLQHKRYVGSKPTDISLLNGKLYIALRGETHIGIIDVNDIQSNVERVLIDSNPDRVIPSKGHIFYWGQDTFREFHATNGTRDVAVGDLRAYDGAAYYESVSDVLYIAEDGEIQKIDPYTLTVLSSVTVTGLNCNSRMLISGDSMYYCNKKASLSDPGSIAGTYPETITHVFGDNVFSATAIYDKETFTKTAGLPFAIREVFQDGDGTLYVSNEKQLYKFRGVEGMNEYIRSMMTPALLEVVDLGELPNQVTGIAILHPAEDDNHLNGYSLFYLDADKNKISPVQTWSEYDPDYDIYVYNLNITNIPGNAVYIGAFSSPKNQSLTDIPPATALIWDVPAYFASEFSFTAGSASSGSVKGTVSWKPGAEYANTTYKLWFYGNEGTIGESLATRAGGQTSYVYELPLTALPDGAMGLALTQEREGSSAYYYQIIIFDGYTTPNIETRDIMITKNASADDEVRVTNVNPGDKISVYTDGGYLLGETVVPSGSHTVALKIYNIGNPGQKLIVTKTSPGKYESDGTVVIVPQSNGGGGGGIPIPNPGGGGGGNGGILPPSGGSGLPSPKEPTDEAEQTLLEAEIEQINGERIGRVAIANDELTSQTETNSFAEDRTIRLETGSEETIIVFELTGSGVRNLLKTSRDTRLEFTTPSGSFIIRAEELQDAVEGAGQAERFEIRLERVESKNELEEALTLGTELLGVPVAFEAYAVVSGKKQELNDFASYVEHVLTFKMAKPSYDSLAGLMLAQNGKSYVPVPVKFEYADGVLKASLFRKGNSIYAVAKNSVSFNDLPNSAAYKKSIQFLANKMVVNGFPDGSFKPDQSVTRAEFAAMLNRALGLLPSTAPAETGFHDVKMQDWFAGNVNSAVEAGLILGYEDGSFRPADTINHQEMLTMLVRALNYAGHSLPASAPLDAAIQEQLEDWFEPSYSSAQGVGMLKGSGDPFVFSAKAEATRQQCALLLHRMLNDILFT